MGFHSTVKLLLVSIFLSSCLAIFFGGLSLNDSKWLVDANGKGNKTKGFETKDNETLKVFYSLGFTFQVLAMLVMGLIVLASVFNFDSFEQKWNIYVVVFINILTLFLMGFFIMLLSAFKLVSEPGCEVQYNICVASYKLSSKSQSFIYFLVNIFWSFCVIGLVCFSLGYISVNRFNEADDDSTSQYQNRTLSKSATSGQRNLTHHQVPAGIPDVPNAFSNSAALSYRQS